MVDTQFRTIPADAQTVVVLLLVILLVMGQSFAQASRRSLYRSVAVAKCKPCWTAVHCDIFQLHIGLGCNEITTTKHESLRITMKKVSRHKSIDFIISQFQFNSKIEKKHP